jgi:hypothetical protein
MLEQEAHRAFLIMMRTFICVRTKVLRGRQIEVFDPNLHEGEESERSRAIGIRPTTKVDQTTSGSSNNRHSLSHVVH